MHSLCHYFCTENRNIRIWLGAFPRPIHVANIIFIQNRCLFQNHQCMSLRLEVAQICDLCVPVTLQEYAKKVTSISTGFFFLYNVITSRVKVKQ